MHSGLRDYLHRVEMSSANLYLRLSDRARKEGQPALAKMLHTRACQERAHAYRLNPQAFAGKGKGLKTQWTYCQLKKGQPWVRQANLRSESYLMALYFRGLDTATSPLNVVLKALGSGELGLSFVYFLLGDFRSAKEEIIHACTLGVSPRYLVWGIICVILGLMQGLKAI